MKLGFSNFEWYRRVRAHAWQISTPKENILRQVWKMYLNCELRVTFRGYLLAPAGCYAELQNLRIAFSGSPIIVCIPGLKPFVLEMWNKCFWAPGLIMDARYYVIIRIRVCPSRWMRFFPGLNRSRAISSGIRPLFSIRPSDSFRVFLT